MEDSFRVRVDKVFGSLPTSSNIPPPLSSRWCLTDDEIPRKEWNRDSNEDHHTSDSMPNLDGFVFPNYANPSSSQPGSSYSNLHIQLCETDLVRPDDDDEWNIRSSIGLDCTLDYEEEEDKYDKVAVGSEDVDDHLYMNDATEYEIGVNTYNEIPVTLQDCVRDSRADHLAAKLRLKEDAEAAGNFDLLRLSDTSKTSSFLSEDGSSRKSIIKKREGQTDIKTQKRVRFNDKSLEGSLVSTKENCSGEDLNVFQDTLVPDYIRNPSHYTHYTFDEDADMDDNSNRKAYLDFLSLVRKPSTTGVQHQADHPPKLLTFNRKKTNLYKMGIKCPNVQVGKCLQVRMAVSDDSPEEEVSAMKEDDHGILVDTVNSTSKSSRQYRARTKMDSDDQE